MDLTSYEDDYRANLAQFGPRHPDTLAAARVLGQALSAAGKYQEAVDLWRLIAEVEASISGPADPSVLTARGFLGRALSDAQRHDDAVAVLDELLRDRMRVLGPEDRQTLVTKGNLARALGLGGQLDEAMRLTREVLEARERTLGPADPDTFDSLGNLAHLLSKADRHEEALVLFEEALARRRTVLVEDDPVTRSSRFNVAVTRSRIDPEGALAELRAFVVDAVADGSADDRSTLLARAHYAMALSATGHRVEAIDEYRQLIVDRTRVLGPHDWATLKARLNLGLLLSEGESDEDLVDGMETLGSLLEDTRMAFGDDGELTLEVELAFAMLLLDAGRVARAIRWLERIRPLVERRFDRNHPVRRRVLETLDEARWELELEEQSR